MTMPEPETLQKYARQHLIVALDFPTPEPALKLVQSLGESVLYYKVGKELFTAAGPDVVRQLVGMGKKVFLDLKFHDIPNTVAGAVKSAAALGVSLLTVHALGGSKMLKAAADAARESASKPTVLAVTVLTSMSQADVSELGIAGTVEDEVLRLAGLAIGAGCGGIVTSAHEAPKVRQSYGRSFAIVTPGIRPAGASVGDQARVVTPSEAIRAGVSHMVVGRPITAAPEPQQAARAILDEITAAL